MTRRQALKTSMQAVRVGKQARPAVAADLAVVAGVVAAAMSECVAAFTGNLAELALNREDWPAAERLAREALALDEPVGRKELIAKDCHRLAKALARQGRGAEGRCHAERAVALLTELRSPDLAEAQATLAECRA